VLFDFAFQSRKALRVLFFYLLGFRAD